MILGLPTAFNTRADMIRFGCALLIYALAIMYLMSRIPALDTAVRHLIAVALAMYINNVK